MSPSGIARPRTRGLRQVWCWPSQRCGSRGRWPARSRIGPSSDTIQFVAARIILFGVLSYALVSAVRIYRAEAHNQVVNAHRHHALRTFETFTAASSDDATRNAVLMQATQCIFSHRPSGFGQREDDAAPQSQVLELTRNVLPKTSE